MEAIFSNAEMPSSEIISEFAEFQASLLFLFSGILEVCLHGASHGGCLAPSEMCLEMETIGLFPEVYTLVRPCIRMKEIMQQFMS